MKMGQVTEIIEKLDTLLTALDTLYTGPETGLIWSDPVSTPTTVYEGACNLYRILFVSYSGNHRAYLNDAISGSGSQKFQMWVPDTGTYMLNLVGTPIPFTTGLRVSWLSGTSSHLALKLCYRPD